ncbi:unnamed protein product [Calicophoron daubneyi]|uniref:Transient receptor potential cation channel subfamily A member 1 n=1 Tax=Calicophoron daubneyi TaxID=300641 RepID=A0AAV2TRV8_CALDB
MLEKDKLSATTQNVMTVLFPFSIKKIVNMRTSESTEPISVSQVDEEDRITSGSDSGTIPDELRFQRGKDAWKNFTHNFHGVCNRTSGKKSVSQNREQLLASKIFRTLRAHAPGGLGFPLGAVDEQTLLLGFQYANSGQLGELFDALLEAPDLIHAHNANGKSLLHCAVEKGSHEMVNMLLLRGADPTDCDNDGNQPMHSAVSQGEMKMVEILMKHGGSLSCPNNEGVQPIHLACEANFAKCVKMILLLTDVDLNAPDVRGSTPVHYCCISNSKESLEILLDHGADIYMKNAFESYPIHVAIMNVAVDCVDVLFKYESENLCRQSLLGAPQIETFLKLQVPQVARRLSSMRPSIRSDFRPSIDNCSSSHRSSIVSTFSEDESHLINLVDGEGFCPIHMAVNSGNIKLVKICLDRGANVFAKDLNGKTALHFACAREDIECARLLIDSHPKSESSMLRATDNDGRTPLHLVAMHDCAEMITYLVEQGADINRPDRAGATPLMLASEKGAINAATRLLQLGADVHKTDRDHRNICSLMLLGSCGVARYAIADLMRKRDLADLFSIPDNWGCTFMHIAARLGLKASFKLALSFGAKLLVKDSEHATPLHSAAEFARFDICQQILETDEGRRALSLGDQRGRLPLHIASQHGHNRIVELFLSNGCLFRRCHEGNTPLHYAAMSGDAETCTILLRMNPSILNETNFHGLTALHYAAQYSNQEVTEYLLSAGAEIVPDLQGTYFTTFALVPENYAAARAIALHRRWPEILQRLRGTEQCPIERFIRNIPSLCLVVMDRYVTEIGTRNDAHYGTQFDFRLFEPPMETKQDRSADSLRLVKIMVELKREDLLVHPLTTAYLELKWHKYGRWIHLFSLFYHICMSFAITGFALRQMPLTVKYHDPEVRDCVDRLYSNPKRMFINFIILTTIMIMNIIHWIKIGSDIFTEEFERYVPSLQARLADCFVGFEHLNRSRYNPDDPIQLTLSITAFANIRLAFFQTLMMMVGEYDHTETVIKPYLDPHSSTIYIPELTFPLFVAFTFLVPISFMNLMIGLAVGDIDKVHRSATQQLIAQQVYWLSGVEQRFPFWLYKKVCAEQWFKRTGVKIPERDIHDGEIKKKLAKLKEKLKANLEVLERQTTMFDAVLRKYGISLYEADEDTGVFVDDAESGTGRRRTAQRADWRKRSSAAK